jgi:hypothetical protein
MSAALFRYAHSYHSQESIPKRQDAKAFATAAKIARHLVTHTSSMQENTGARFHVNDMPGLLRVVGYRNVLAIPRLVDYLNFFVFSADGVARLILSQHKGRIGAPPQSAKRAFLKRLCAIWRIAGTGTPTSTNSSFLTFLETVDKGLPVPLKLGTREAISKFLRSKKKKTRLCHRS